jgi:hypothetical protein
MRVMLGNLDSSLGTIWSLVSDVELYGQDSRGLAGSSTPLEEEDCRRVGKRMRSV